MMSHPFLKALTCLLAAFPVLDLKMFDVLLCRHASLFRICGFSCVLSPVRAEHPLFLCFGLHGRAFLCSCHVLYPLLYSFSFFYQ